MTLDPGLFLLAAVSFPIAAVAMLIERLLGYPNGCQDWFGHPIEWIGRLVASQDAALNAGDNRKMKGVIALGVVIALTVIATVPLTLWLRGLENGWVFEALLASAFLSQKSLEDHVRAVADGLDRSLAAGRKAVSRIIGRDPKKLDRSDIAKGAIESLAENMSDGVVAPLFWLIIAGLPGIAIYKAVNTADSMIGYRSDRYREFGWASARLDDVLNLVPARFTGWLVAASAALHPSRSGRKAVAAMARDAKKHVSPNAGWPEAAMAGALGVRLGGPRSYDGKKVDLAAMGDGKDKLDAKDIRGGLGLYATGLNLLTAAVIMACIMSWAP